VATAAARRTQKLGQIVSITSALFVEHVLNVQSSKVVYNFAKRNKKKLYKGKKEQDALIVGAGNLLRLRVPVAEARAGPRLKRTQIQSSSGT